MLFGFVLMRYQFVGIIAWDMIVHLTRWSQFVDRVSNTVYITTIL